MRVAKNIGSSLLRINKEEVDVAIYSLWNLFLHKAKKLKSLWRKKVQKGLREMVVGVMMQRLFWFTYLIRTYESGGT